MNTITMVTHQQLRDIAIEVIKKDYEYDHVGLRVQESDYGVTIGDQVTHRSYHWIDGDMTDEEIDGICAIDAEQAAARKGTHYSGYIGNTVLVLGSNSAMWGEDIGEIILQPAYGNDPTILDIIYVTQEG